MTREIKVDLLKYIIKYSIKIHNGHIYTIQLYNFIKEPWYASRKQSFSNQTFCLQIFIKLQNTCLFGKYICKQIACVRLIDKLTECCLIWFRMINWYLTGPFNPRTLEDFWEVIWQNNTSRIVMLTNTFEGDRVSGRICIVTACPSLKKIFFFLVILLLQTKDTSHTTEF